MNKVERPNPNDWCHKEGRIFKESRGKCLCSTVEQMRTCLHYRSSAVMLCLHLSENLCDCKWSDND